MNLARYSKILCVAVLFLIFMGANVTTHGAGLAVPDWPTTYGHNMFTFPVGMWIDGIFHEHVHRLVASGIGMLTIVLVVWTLIVEKRRWLRNLTWLSLLLVIVQGILGGLTVWMMLPAWTSSLHGVLGQTFFCVVIAIAYFHSAEFHSAEFEKGVNAGRSPLAPWAFVLLGLVYVQLFIAVFLRHTESGLALLDFPTMAGSWIPSISSETVARVNDARKAIGLIPVEAHQVLLQLMHRGMAIVLMVFAFLLLRRTRKLNLKGVLSSNTKLIVFVLLVQFALGVTTVLTQRWPIPTSLHVMTGALTLGLSFLLVLRSLNVSRE